MEGILCWICSGHFKSVVIQMFSQDKEKWEFYSYVLFFSLISLMIEKDEKELIEVPVTENTASTSHNLFGLI